MRGGKRSGAGRPKGVANRVAEEIRQREHNSGELMPLDYMLDRLRNSDDESQRERMAIAAAPYLHAKVLPKVAKDDQAGVEVTWQLKLTKRYGLTSQEINSLNFTTDTSDGASLSPTDEPERLSPVLLTSSYKPPSSQGSS